jgi:pimeloyl-ACP methyl ester carboxylesterase
MKRVALVLCVASLAVWLPTSVSGQDVEVANAYDSVAVNGITLAYRVIGEGEPLVLLHGFSETGRSWSGVLDDLSAHYRVIVPDLRGHGRSTNPSGRFTHRQSALDIFALLDRLGVSAFRAMGISTGGMTLLHMATGQPQRVEAMVLIGATSHFPEQAREIMRASDPESLSVEALERRGQAHSGGAEQARALASQFFAFKDSYDDMNFTRPYLSTITASTLIVHGDRDAFFPVSIPVEEYEAIPDSYLWIVPNGGHVPLLGPERERTFFTEVVLDFLAGQWR